MMMVVVGRLLFITSYSQDCLRQIRGLRFLYPTIAALSKLATPALVGDLTDNYSPHAVDSLP